MTATQLSLRLHFANFCAAHRDELCEKSMQIGGEYRRPTWGELFELKHGLSLDEFDRQQRAEKVA